MWEGGGHVRCGERSQERAVFTAGKGERVVRQPSSNQTTHTHSTQFVSRSGPKGPTARSAKRSGGAESGS